MNGKKLYEQVTDTPVGVGVSVLGDGRLVVCGREFPRGCAVCVTTASVGTVAVSVWDAETARESAGEMGGGKGAVGGKSVGGNRLARHRKPFKKWKADGPYMVGDEQMRKALQELVARCPRRCRSWYTKQPIHAGGVRGDDGRKWRLLAEMVDEGILKKVEAEKPNRRLKYVLELAGVGVTGETIKEAV